MLPLFWLLADEETFLLKDVFCLYGAEADHKSIPATSQLICRSKLLWMSDREVEFVWGGSALSDYARILHCARVRSFLSSPSCWQRDNWHY